MAYPAGMFTSWGFLSSDNATFTPFLYRSSMPVDFLPAEDRRLAGLANYNNGLAAENSVAAAYEQDGVRIVAERWCGAAGEIDLIGQDDDGFVFVEVKRARTFAAAAERLTQRQLQRIMLSAEDYIGKICPGQLVNLRVDLALVDGTARIEILKNITLT